jgi:hypothetical protein
LARDVSKPQTFDQPVDAGMTINVSKVDEIIPPIIWTAMRCVGVLKPNRSDRISLSVAGGLVFVESLSTL